MSKRKRKWFGYGGDKDPYYDDLFSNTRRQHQEKLNKANKTYDDDGLVIEEIETDYLEDYSYDYGFNKSFGKKSYDFNKDWKSYSSTGYSNFSYNNYRVATLTYKYVQQMANSIANQSNIRAIIGNTWSADIRNKQLTYNPTSLMYGTKGELLATLLHETGKIAHSTDSRDINSKYLQDNVMGNGAKVALSIFEGTRIDMIMLKSYPSASEVYESNTNVVKKVVEEYRKNAEELRKQLIRESHEMVGTLMTNIQQQMQARGMTRMDINSPSFKTLLTDVTKKVIGFEIDDAQMLQAHFEDYIKKQKEEPLLGEYVAEMMRLSYGIDLEPDNRVKNYVDATYKFVAPASRMKSTNEVVTMLDKDVYPIIEPLLRQQFEGTQSQQESFGAQSAKYMMQNAQRRNFLHQLTDENGNELPRLSGGRSDMNKVPMEWYNGEYEPLRESVDYEIKQLINRLNFIKREEDTIRYVGNERRGKLDTKKLYRFATGNTRLFKRQLPKRDTVRSFAFSILVDVSGSMDGERIINATRGLIMLSEVFTKFDMPFEIICFNAEPEVLKTFEQSVDKNLKSKIGGVARMAGGGTTLSKALEKSKLHTRTESNKICIVLSDGDTEDYDELDNEFFIPWEKKGIKSIGIGIEIGSPSFSKFCHGNGIDVSHSNKLPTEFSNLLKKLIKRK